MENIGFVLGLSNQLTPPSIVPSSGSNKLPCKAQKVHLAARAHCPNIKLKEPLPPSRNTAASLTRNHPELYSCENLLQYLSTRTAGKNRRVEEFTPIIHYHPSQNLLQYLSLDSGKQQSEKNSPHHHPSQNLLQYSLRTVGKSRQRKVHPYHPSHPPVTKSCYLVRVASL